MSENTQKIATLENEVQANWLESILKEQGIPHIIRSYHDSAYNGLFQATKGWGHVEAPGEYKERILSILQDLKTDLENEPYTQSVEDVPSEELKVGKKAFKQVLIGPDVGPNFAMRRFVIEPSGYMPNHTNTVEHEQYVLAGRAQIGIGEKVIDVQKDDVVFIPQGVPHWYKVVGEEAFIFLCVVPNLKDEMKILER
jgi:quercetin dioxygenase-like cupin family protein